MASPTQNFAHLHGASEASIEKTRKRLGRERWRKACIEACWENGDLSYVLHPGQQEAMELVREAEARRVRRCVLNIARRWGKSLFGITYASEIALNHEAARVPYAAMTGQSVEEFIEPHLMQLAADAPPKLRPLDKGGEWIFPSTDSRIRLRGCEDRKKANRLRGPYAHAAVVDEAGFIECLDYVVRSVMAPQLITTDGMMLVMSSPPETPDHPFVELATEAEMRGVYMVRTIYDAPHLTAQQIESYCEEAGGPESTAWEREGLAKFTADKKLAIVPEFAKLEDEIVCEVARPDHFDCYVVGDLGYVDLTVILFGYYHYESALLVIEDEVVLHRPNSAILQAETRKKEVDLWGGDKEPVVRAVDTSQWVASDLRALQDDDETAEKQRWQITPNDDLQAQVNALRLLVSRKRVRIHPRCKTLRAHMRNGVWNDQRTAFKRIKHGEQGHHHFDAVAAALYMNRAIRRDRDPNPLIPSGVHPHTHRIPPELRIQERVSKWKKAFARPVRR